MMLALSVVLLAATPAPLKVAVPDFSVINVEKDSAGFFIDRFANRLRSKGVSVTTAAEIETVLGLERQKALLGCSETSGSCQAEIAAALGADAIVRGRIAKFGQRFELSFTLIDPADAGVLASVSSSAAEEGKVLDQLDEAADQLATKLFAAKRPGLAIPQVSATSSAPPSRWIGVALPLGSGVAATVVGSVELAMSYATRDQIATAENPTQTAADAKFQRAFGISMLCLGGAALTTGAILLFTGAKPAATPVAMITPQGAYVGVEGRLP